jgi:hypothetical protein
VADVIAGLNTAAGGCTTAGHGRIPCTNNGTGTPRLSEGGVFTGSPAAGQG